MTWRLDVTVRIGGLSVEVDIDGDETPVVLIGPNGSGKTTLLRTFAGALTPRRGVISLDDRTVFDAERGVDLPSELRRVGYVPQGYGLFPHLDVLDNVAFGRPRGPGAGPRPRGERRRAARELLDAMGCAHLCGRTPARLSGGEQQQVALARALFIEPEILLLDEPLAALDPPARRRVRRSLAQRLTASRVPALVVTHDHRDVRALGARVVALESGRVVQRGTAAEMAARPATEFIAEFFASSE